MSPEILKHYLRPYNEAIAELKLDYTYTHIRAIIEGTKHNSTIMQKLVGLALKRARQERELIEIYKDNKRREAEVTS